MKITYRNGYPSKTCVDKIIEEFFKDIQGYFPFMTDNIKYSGSISYQRSYMNEHINNLVDFFTEKGIAVKDIRLYESPYTGAIKFEKK